MSTDRRNRRSDAALAGEPGSGRREFGLLLRRGDTPDTLLAHHDLPVREDRDYVVTWIGLPLLAGHDDPTVAVSAALDRVRDDDGIDLVTDIDGIFALFVFVKTARRWYVFGDQGGLMRLFFDSRAVSTSFLGLLATGGYDYTSLDRVRLLEFVLHEGTFGSTTVVHGVNVLLPQYQLLVDSREIRILPRQRTTPRSNGENLLASFFSRYRSPLVSHKTSVDLTGGADSRVVFSFARRHLPVAEAAVIGDPGSPDVRIASELATRCGVPIHVHHHTIERLEMEIWPTFVAGDGLIDIAHFHPNWQHMHVRLSRGVELIVHGGGGELYRDAYCLQDFPFYDILKPRFERFYDWRLCPFASQVGWWVFADDVARVRSASLALMQSLTTCRNCTTYDRIFYTLKAPPLFGQFFSAYIRMGCAVVAPFLDWCNAGWAISQPGSRKFMHRWHRRALAAAQPDLATVPTVEGHRLLGGLWGLIGDVPDYGAVWARKIGRKATQRLLGKTKFLYGSSTVAEASGFTEALRESSELRTALRVLTRAGFIKSDIRTTAIHPSHLGRVLAMGMLLQFLEGRR